MNVVKKILVLSVALGSIAAFVDRAMACEEIESQVVAKLTQADRAAAAPQGDPEQQQDKTPVDPAKTRPVGTAQLDTSEQTPLRAALEPQSEF